MNKRNLSSILMTGALLVFSGCFDVQFNFKTHIHSDGTIARETKIEGRGANLFKAPSGPGWQAKTWETKGGEAVLPNTYYHIQATGQFKTGGVIPPDYEFDVPRQLNAWGDEEKKQVELAGIKQPYEENLFSRNRIQIQMVSGWLTKTFFYEETFQTLGEIDVLMYDIKEEIKKQRLDKGNGALNDAELTQLAKIRLEDEFLAQFRFLSEVTMPGKIISSNAGRSGHGTVSWQFSMKDFENNYSTYTLRAVSRVLQVPGMIILAGLAGLGVLLVFIFLAGASKVKQPAKPKKTPKA